MNRTSISWTDATWNPVTGCTKISPGCKLCYADRLFLRTYSGMCKCGHPLSEHVLGRWPHCGHAACSCATFVQRQFTDVRTHPDRLEQPVHWKKGKRIFVNSMSDLFHEDVPFEFIDLIFAVMAVTPQHTYQILTKRAVRMLEYVSYVNEYDLSRARSEICGINRYSATPWPLPNVWLGVSVENPDQLFRVDTLLEIPNAMPWVSYEPALAGVNFAPYFENGITQRWDRHLRWLVFGGESGPGARPCNLKWARDVRDQCKAARVPFFFKQGGRTAYREVGGTIYHYGFRDRKGEDLYEIPEDLRIREFPK